MRSIPVKLIVFFALLNVVMAHAGAAVRSAEKNLNVLILQDSSWITNSGSISLKNGLEKQYLIGNVSIIHSKRATPESLAQQLIEYHLSLDESSSFLLVILSKWDALHKGLPLGNGMLSAGDIDDLLIGNRSLGVFETCLKSPGFASAIIVYCNINEKSKFPFSISSRLAPSLGQVFSDSFPDERPYLDGLGILSGLARVLLPLWHQALPDQLRFPCEFLQYPQETL